VAKSLKTRWKIDGTGTELQAFSEGKLSPIANYHFWKFPNIVEKSTF
jgi:hypothetical protein